MQVEWLGSPFWGVWATSVLDCQRADTVCITSVGATAWVPRRGCHGVGATAWVQRQGLDAAAIIAIIAALLALLGGVAGGVFYLKGKKVGPSSLPLLLPAWHRCRCRCPLLPAASP